MKEIQEKHLELSRSIQMTFNQKLWDKFIENNMIVVRFPRQDTVILLQQL